MAPAKKPPAMWIDFFAPAAAIAVAFLMMAPLENAQGEQFYAGFSTISESLRSMAEPSVDHSGPSAYQSFAVHSIDFFAFGFGPLMLLAGAIAGLTSQPCVSFEAGDGVTLPQIPTMATTPNLFTKYNIGSQFVISGDATQVPTAVSLYTAPAGGAIIAGIPHINFDVSPTASVSTGTPMVFVGIGILHKSNSALWDLMDNQVYPLRGIGAYDIDIIGGGARLQPGDQLGVLFFGLNQQFAANGNISVANPTIEPITVTGNVYLPILPNTPANI